AIMEQEVPVLDRGAREVRVPFFVKEIVAQLTFEARGSNEINQSSGVSVRVTINNYESLLSNAEKRAVRTGEREIVPRLSDLPSVLASMAGKIELEYVGEDKKDGNRDRVRARRPAPPPEAEQGPFRRALRLPGLSPDPRMHRVRYTAWDGTQQVRLSADDVFEKLSEYLSFTDDVQQALDWLLHQ